MRLSTRGAIAIGLLLATAPAALASVPAFELKWGSFGSAEGEFNLPRGVASDASGNVYVADTDNHRIQKFTSSGAFVAAWGSLGSESGPLNMPTAVATGPGGNVYVADTMNHRIVKFSSAGAVLATWGGEGSDEGQLGAPQGIAVGAGGNVYVADTWNHRIQKFTSSGAFVGEWETFSPNGIATDGAGNVYVAESAYHLVRMFTSDGALLLEWGSEGSGDGHFKVPTDVAVDPLGNVYVSDTGNHRIQKFSADGTFLDKWGSDGSGDGQFRLPTGITSDSSGNIYAADVENHRIQKFGTSAASDTAVVAAEVSVQQAAACLELVTDAVSFGTLPFAASNAPATPAIVVRNCRGGSETLRARATDAGGEGATWSLVDSTATCATSLGSNNYRLNLQRVADGNVVRLGTNNKTIETLAGGADATHVAHIHTACPGSAGGGVTMHMQIVFVATD